MATSSNFKEELITRLRDLIDLRGRSLAGIEKELGRGRGYVGDAFRGGKRLSLDVVLHILEALGIEPEDFFAGEVEEEKRLQEMSRKYERDKAKPRKGGKAKALQEARRGQKVTADAAARLYSDLIDVKSPTEKRTVTVLLSLVQLLEGKGHIDHRELLAVLEERMRDES